MVNFYDRRLVSIMSLCVLMIYIVGTYQLKSIYQCGFDEIVLFKQNHLSLASGVISFFVFLAGFLLLFVIPGWIFSLHSKYLKKEFPIFIGSSFFISLIGLMIAATFYKLAFPGPLDKVNFLGLLCFVISTGLISLWCRPAEIFETDSESRFDLNQLLPYATMIFATFAVAMIFHNQLLDTRALSYNFSQEQVLSIPLGELPDDLEIFGLADSLKHHLLPYWDLEYVNRFGYVFTDPPLYAFVSIFSLLLFGESKSSLTLISFAFITITFLIILAQAQGGKLLRLLVCISLMLAYFLFFLKRTIVFVFEPHFFAFLLIVTYLYLIRKNYTMFLLFAMLATFTKYYGIFFVLLGIAGIAIFYNKRKNECIELLIKYSYIVMGLIGGIVLMGLTTGNLAVYWEVFLIESFSLFDFI